MSEQTRINRKFERLIGSFPGDCQYNRTLEAEGRHQADLQQRSMIQNDISDEVGCILLGTSTRYLDTGETTFVKADSLEKNIEIIQNTLINNF